MTSTPHATARRAGTLYLISTVPAAFSVFVLMKLVVKGDPAATAANVLGAEGLFRMGFVADLTGIMFVVGAILCFYELFKPVSGPLALQMVFFGLIGSVIQCFNALQDLTALILLKGGDSMAALTAAQSQSLAYVFLRLHSLTYDLALMFFGVFVFSIGRLILKSSVLPRILGVLMLIDGLGYLTFSLTTFLSPALAARLYPILPFMTAAIGEMPLMVWLVVKGVSAPRADRLAGT